MKFDIFDNNSFFNKKYQIVGNCKTDADFTKMNIPIYDLLNEIKRAEYNNFVIELDVDDFSFYALAANNDDTGKAITIWNIPKKLVFEFIKYKNEFNIDTEIVEVGLKSIIDSYNNLSDEDKLIVNLILREG